MNPASILALIGDLYEQVAALSEENQTLRDLIEQAGQDIEGDQH